MGGGLSCLSVWFVSAMWGINADTDGRTNVYLVALVLLVELEHEEVDGEEARDEEEGVHAIGR